MSQDTRAQARCGECGKAYRVPEAGRSYTCKACGGTVQVDDPLAGMLTCSACQAINPAGSRFCAECGAGIGAAPPSRSDPSVRDRRRAASELNRAFRRIRGIRWLYRLGAVAYGLATLVLVLLVGSPEEPLGSALLFVGLFTTLTVLMIVGAIQIRFQPMVWTVIVAALATLSAVLELFESGPASFQFLWSLSWAALFWLAVAPTVRFRNLIERHPDLYIVHRIHGTQHERALGHRANEPAQARSLRLLAEARRRAWKLSGLAAAGFLLASVLGTATVYSKVRPEEFAPREELFRGAWNDGDLERVGALFAPDLREKRSAWLGGVIAGNEWGRTWPPIETPVLDEGERMVVAEYYVDEGLVVARWLVHEGEWFLVDLRVPLPPLDVAFGRFVEAWDASDVDGIAGLFAPESREKLEGSIRRSVAVRSWEKFPRILDWRELPSPPEIVEVLIETRGGELTTRWQLGDDGTWALKSLRLPRR